MAILSLKQIAAIQRIGEMTFSVTCDIYKRLPYAADDTNPYGDDTITYETKYKRVKGWLVPTASADFLTDSAQVISSGQFVLRVPVGTDVEPGDKVRIASKDYSCVDSTTEQTWPEWTIVRLRRIQ